MSNNLIFKACRRLGKEIKSFAETVKYYSLFIPAKCLYRKREIYLFAERGDDARDNGFHLYRYFRENAPEKEAYYVIDKKSGDRKKLESYGNLIHFGSLRHYLMFIGSKYKISTHIMGYSPDMMFYCSFNQKHRVPGYQIFLQHGVIQNDHPGLYRESTKADVFICGAKPEYDFIKGTFHYANDEVRYTGLARYDALMDFQTKQQILFMPTWRIYNKNLNRQQFQQSEYFQMWNGLMQNKKLLEKLHEKQIKLYFYPHYEMQKFVDCFLPASEDVVIADFDHYDVQILLKESKLLVTDYSSVFFDFAYMRKPTVYFQFDKEKFESEQYSKGYFEYESMGFGEVTERIDETCDAICDYLDRDCTMRSIYEERISDFFPLRDVHNCDRIMRIIENL